MMADALFEASTPFSRVMCNRHMVGKNTFIIPNNSKSTAFAFVDLASMVLERKECLQTCLVTRYNTLCYGTISQFFLVLCQWIGR